MASENWRPAKWLEQPPMVIGIFQHDTREMPMKAVIDDLETVLARPGVVGGSVAQGYPWSDVHENGLACYVLHEDSEETAKDGARWIVARRCIHQLGHQQPRPSSMPWQNHRR